VENGGVLVQNGLILEVGAFGAVKAAAPAHAGYVDHGSAALLPALVNAHTHLELSGLEGRIRLPQDSFASWIEELLPHRSALTPEAQREGAAKGERQIAAAGTGLYADVMNGLNGPTEPADSLPARQAFFEVLGFNRESMETAVEASLLKSFNAAAERNASLSLAAHACYSTSAELIRSAKKWSRKRGRVFSIHVAEHLEEVELLENGSGFFRRLLENLGRWVPDWTAPRMSPIEYLEKLAVLDERTLLVHAVHMTEADWRIVSRYGCPVCFCPRSNQNLNVGRADVGKALQLSIPAALGTDSLASNTDLSLFSEAAHILESYSPAPASDALLSMMTMGGARALLQNHLFGSIEAGKRALLLAVSLPGSVSPHKLSETIIFQGKKGAWQWASCPTTK
jgi:cytosine/adenosine deaminase-related metal-dependent hydrolase